MHDSAADGPSRYMGAWKDPENIPIWRWLEQQCEAYPNDKFIAPMRPRRDRVRRRVFAGAALAWPDDGDSGGDRRRELVVDRDGGRLTVQLGDTPDDAGAIAQHLFTHEHRGSIVVLADGARRSLHVLLRLCWRRWVELGYRVKPLGVGTELRYVVVSRSRHAWYLADWEAVTGLCAEGNVETLAGCAKQGGNFDDMACRVCRAASRYQEVVNGHFGVSCGLTVGSTAVAAACRHVPADRWVWRPNPGLVALCRAGGGFRGGHVYYPPYQGPVHRLDLRRAYTWALGGELPCGAVQSPCVVDGAEQPGIYLCRVYGPGTHPVSLATWDGAERGFVRRNWSGGETVAVLCSEEFDGLRALGYAVSPGYGYRWKHTFTLAGFAAACEQLLAANDASSAVGMIAKRLANAVYGKFAERPIRQETIMARERPSADHKPMVDAAGEEVTDVWTRWVRSWRPHQHVDVAAVVTARVRARLYTAVAGLAAAGVRVLAADTDGLLVDQHPADVMGVDAGRPGDWRYDGYSALETVSGPRFFTFRGTVAVAGTSPQPAAVVAAAFDRGTVTVEGKVMAPPWSDGAIARTVERTLRRGVGFG